MYDKRDAVEEKAEPSARLFIGGLAWEATEDDLKAAFSPFGELVSANVARYSDTGRSKGFGFVEFATVEEATKAKEEMDGKEIAGRAIKADFARPRAPKAE